MVWRQNIAHFLDADSSLMNPLFQRQSNVLRLAHSHACILVHRPSLLSNFANLRRKSHSRTSLHASTEDGVSKCLQAAMNIVTIVNDLHVHGQIYRAFWVRLHSSDYMTLYCSHSNSSHTIMPSVQLLYSTYTPFSAVPTRNPPGKNISPRPHVANNKYMLCEGRKIP